MPIRISGLTSGLDTESIVGALVSAYSYKKDKYVKAQTKVSWKQDAWKALNTKVYSLYTSVGSMRYSSNYAVKKTTVSDTTKAKATASGTAINGTQSLKINKLASTAYITGAQLEGNVTGSSTLASLGIKTDSSGEKASISLRTGTKVTNVDIEGSMTINQFVNKLKDAGVEANFDEKNRRFYISAKTSGKAGDFTLSANTSMGLSSLTKLGLLSGEEISDIKDSASSAGMAKKVMPFTVDGNSSKLMDSTELKTLLTSVMEYKKDPSSVTDADKIAEYDSIVSYLEENYGEEGVINWEDMTEDELSELVGNVYKDAAYDTTGTKVNTATRSLIYTVGEGDDKKTYTLSGSLADIKSKLQSLATATDEESTALKEYLNKKYSDEVYKTTRDENNNIVVEKYGSGGTIDWDNLDDEKLSKLAEDVYTSGTYDISNDATYKELQTSINAVRDGYLAVAAAKALPQKTSEEIAIRSEKLREAQEQLSTALADPTNAKWAKYVEENFGAQNSEYDSSYSDFWTQTDNIDLISSVYYRVDLAANIQAGNVDIDPGNVAKKVDGADAEIELNGVVYTNGTNSITVNGLTIEAMATTGDSEITVTVNNDIDGIYDKVKDFLTQYNNLMNEMQKLYNADSAKDYEPLTDDEKAEMSEDQIEKWEQKIKDSLLRRDNSLSSIISAMTMSMMKTIEIDGKTYAWSTFGVHTLGNMNAEKNEGYAYHIDGDSEDTYTSGKTDKLRTALAEEPDVVIEFLKQMTSNLYSAMDEKMKSTSVKSVYTVYNDKEMASEYSSYSTLIKTWQDRVTDMEDAYYKKFAKMESALAQLQSNSSSITSMLGG
ncbi:flagellar hook-associated protein 2 [Pseudobutyrivibrio sp. YE44]|uniref:flagellar filament capping protein FliD n=1 Tax=Pseudobutyrivibrio sp. YE44 TaxID=1520802 RepID=UPI0008815539|nr:flagellar filament capping protein FliD [Pseudobutyrivibrio sp. YE44]SDB38049.1 flagellar hook-associated protein 2 [Pseudobutyrivibrio sp. YE44]